MIFAALAAGRGIQRPGAIARCRRRVGDADIAFDEVQEVLGLIEGRNGRKSLSSRRPVWALMAAHAASRKRIARRAG